MKEIRIEGFFGYQFISEHFKRSEIDKMVVEAFEKVEADINQGSEIKVKIRPILFNLLSGTHITSQILSRIAQADFCVFEISDLNPNVMFELGYATGQAKPCIFLIHKNKDISEVPSDLSGIFLVRYDYDTFSAKIGFEVYQRVKEILTNIQKRKEIEIDEERRKQPLREFWNLTDPGSVYVVCPEIPKEERIVYAETSARHYLRLARFADIDSLYHLKAFIARIYTNIETIEYTSVEMPSEAYERDLILLGGPAWNKVTETLMRKINSPFMIEDGGKGHDDIIVERKTKNRYLPEVRENGSLQYDYGIFLVIPNPIDNERRLFIINGIRTFGVLGAVKCFTAGDQALNNCKLMIEQFGQSPSFAVLMKIPVVHSNVYPPDLKSDLVSLYHYDQKTKRFRKVG